MTGQNPFQPGAPIQPAYTAPQFCCPYCRSNMPPRVTRNTSQTGLIMCILLLLLCFPLFWLGLLMQEDTRYCSACGAKWG